MKASRHLLRSARASTLRRPLTAQTTLTSSRRLVPAVSSQTRPHPAFFSTSSYRFKGLQPDSSDPEPPKTEPSHDTDVNAGPAQISDAEYHEIADQYLNTLVLALEELAEKKSDGVEAEFSVCTNSLFLHTITTNIQSNTNFASKVMPSNNLTPGRRLNSNPSPTRHLRPQQTTPKPPNLALVSNLRPQTLRLGHPRLLARPQGR